MGWSGVVGLDCWSWVCGEDWEVEPDSEVVTLVSEAGEVRSYSGTVKASGSGASSLPVTMSQSQSAMPPGTMSTAVWGQ